MKKIAISVLLASASMVFADKQSNVGIGLGTEIFKGHDGLMSQTAAATTNGIFGNQTFAITSGTLGAEKPKELWASKQLNNFVAENMDNLAQEIAQGEGESLDAVSSMLNIENSEAFKLALQSNFDSIYTSSEVTHKEVINNMKKAVNG